MIIKLVTRYLYQNYINYTLSFPLFSPDYQASGKYPKIMRCLVNKIYIPFWLLFDIWFVGF